MCNLYSPVRTASEIASLFRASDRTGNAPWPDRAYPDTPAPIVRHSADGAEIVVARWGMPSPPSLLRTTRDPGVTNVRNLASPHWQRWLGRDHRCLVPLAAFAEPIRGGNQWFASTDDSPMFFAGIEVREWSSVCKVKDGETVLDLFAFLTCPPNAEVGAVHPKAMPVILTAPAEWAAWMDGTPATEMQRPLPNGALRLVGAPA